MATPESKGMEEILRKLNNAHDNAEHVKTERAKGNTAEIDSQNPKRLNVSTTVKLSNNTNIISVDLNFGFNFG